MGSTVFVSFRVTSVELIWYTNAISSVYVQMWYVRTSLLLPKQVLVVSVSNSA